MSLTRAQRDHLSEQLKKQWQDPALRAARLKGCVAGGKSVNRDEAYRRRMRLATKGIPKSEEAKRNLSLALQGKPKSPEHAAKCRVVSIGKNLGPYSPERIWSLRFSLLVRAMMNGGFKQWQRRDHRNGGGYKQWRKAVFTAYGKQCFGCKVELKHLDAHHLLSWERFPQLRFEPENGIPLCGRCHKAANALQRHLESLLWPAISTRPLRLVRHA